MCRDWGRGGVCSARTARGRAEARTRALCRSFFVLHCSWWSQLPRTAQARSSAAALRLVPYRAISSHFSPGAAAPNNPAAFAFHTLRCRSRRRDTELGMISSAFDRMAIIIYPAQIGAKRIMALSQAFGLLNLDVQSIRYCFVQMLNGISTLGGLCLCSWSNFNVYLISY